MTERPSQTPGEGAADAGPAPFVTLQRRDDGVALIRLDRPKVNALSTEVLGQLGAIADELHADLPGAVVVWGGERVFAAGADITELASGKASEVGAAFDRALGALASLPRAVIGAVNGYALGGGMELALACDLRICADDATFGLPEALLGVIPGGGGTQRLPRLVGTSRAKELVMTGRRVGAAEGLGMGLVNRVVGPAEVLPAALGLAAELARGALVAQAMAKEAIDRGVEVPLSEGLAIERRSFSAAFGTEDATIGIESFLAHGPGRATFIGR